MTIEMADDIRAEVLGMLQSKVEDIFIDMQNALFVKSGDVSPSDFLALERKEKQLADMIGDILIEQVEASEEKINAHEDERAIIQLYAFASNRESELKKRGGMTWSETDLAAARAYEEVRGEIDRLLRREN